MNKTKLTRDFYGFDYFVRKIERKDFGITKSKFIEKVKEDCGDEYGNDITYELWKSISYEIGDDWDIEFSSEEDFEEFLVNKMVYVYKEIRNG